MEIYPIKYIDEYKIRYDSLNEFYATVCTKIHNWNTVMDSWSTACSTLTQMENFRGAAADAAKTYIQEMHGLLIPSIKQILTLYQTQLLLYITGHYDMESNIDAVIPEDILRNLMGKLGGELWDNELLNDDVQQILNSISDICLLTPPSMEKLQTTLEELRTDIKEYKDKFDSYEYSKYTLANGELQSLIDALYAMVKKFSETAVEITGYQSGTAYAHTEVQNFIEKAQVVDQYVAENEQEISEAMATQAAIYQKQQQEYEALCKERMDTGTAQMLGGGVGAVGTVVTMTVVALTAPAIPALIVIGAGTCVFICCTSDATEGYENYQYGKAGDLTTAAINPIRDVCFEGDMATYNDFKMVSSLVFAASASWAGGVGPGGVVLEVGREYAGGYVCGQIAGAISETVHASNTGGVVIEGLVETVIEGEYDGPNRKPKDAPNITYDADVDNINISGNLMNNTVPVGIVDGKYGSMTDIDMGSVDLYEGGLNSINKLDDLLVDPSKLAGVSGDELYEYLLKNGYDVKPLSKGSYKGIPFEEGGGFKVNWGGDRILQYHPADASHHGGAYFKISSGETGTIRIDLDGNIIE